MNERRLAMDNKYRELLIPEWNLNLEWDWELPEWKLDIPQWDLCLPEWDIEFNWGIELFPIKGALSLRI